MAGWGWLEEDENDWHLFNTSCSFPASLSRSAFVGNTKPALKVWTNSPKFCVVCLQKLFIQNTPLARDPFCDKTTPFNWGLSDHLKAIPEPIHLWKQYFTLNNHNIFMKRIGSIVFTLNNSGIFKASDLWADAFYKSKCPPVCPSVCLSVCLLLRYRLNVFLPPLPKVGCPIF